jgi:hypothetical protein
MAAIFYLLTAFTAIWYYRRIVTKGAGKLILGGILPGFRAAFMAFVIVYSLVTGQLTRTNAGRGRRRRDRPHGPGRGRGAGCGRPFVPALPGAG